MFSTARKRAGPNDCRFSCCFWLLCGLFSIAFKQKCSLDLFFTFSSSSPFAHINKMDANAWKTKGNELFSAKDFPAAVEAFSKAIELDANNHVLYSNRSACYASMQQYDEAVDDAEKCVSLSPAWSKGYVRLGAAFHGVGEHDQAIDAYNKGLALEPDNAALKAGLESVERDKRAATAAPPRADPFAKAFSPDAMARIQASPRLAPYLAQPDYVQIINTLTKQPSLASGFMKDQRIMMTALELMGINLGDMGGDRAGARPFATQPPPSASTTTSIPSGSAAAPPATTSKPAADATAGGPHSEAAKLKEQGNVLYKERKFDEALAKYTAASELDPKNTTYLLNKTAVLFEQGCFDACLAECDVALEHDTEHNHSEFTMIAKLWTRKGSCFQRLKRYDEAIAAFKKALLEHRNSDTLSKLDACEREKKQFDTESYINPELSLKAKEEGNGFFKQDKFPEAVKSYADAIKRNPKDHTLYSNRAAALLKLGAYDDAIRDCDKCLELNPTFVKAFARKGAAYFFTKQYHKALQAYEDGRKLDPNHEECVEGRQRTLMKIQEQASSGEVDEAASRRAMSDPEIQAILNDSYMRLVLDEMNKDPKKIQDYMRDPGISEKLNKLIMAGVLRFGGAPAASSKGGDKRR